MLPRLYYVHYVRFDEVEQLDIAQLVDVDYVQGIITNLTSNIDVYTILSPFEAADKVRVVPHFSCMNAWTWC